jgi:hypothetical protein
MRAFNYTIHLDHAPSAVFAFMMDFSKSSRWRNLVRRIDVVTPGPLRVGSQLLITMDLLGAVKQLPSEVWAYDPPRRYGVRNTANHVSGSFEYQLESQDGGTLLRFTCKIRPHGWMWLALPVLIAESRVRYRAQLSNLKKAMDQDNRPIVNHSPQISESTNH